ncbi:major facilitator superfamily domain-containing protein 4A isoform X3 [Sphaeramia orbicularis]|uniref:major facilitator superfamily domain-containing protein 4A isoform X3 n=1 Tax=Sphaeramia orbicularis TaxID=375764 RepID=UPI00117FE82F|nr:major facilitator superfamily domain-containing protein 4A-like isoform X3 [Sphaeramia orbicularis]
MPLFDGRIWTLFVRHWRQTLTYWSVFFSFGLCIAFLGPTILDLRCQTQSTLQQITWVFFSQQFFLLVGSSVGGLCKRTLASSLYSLFSCTLIISLVFAIIPLCYHVALLSIAMAIAGKAMGVIDTIANLQLVKLYQKDSAVFLQALHFFIGLGALVSPLVADPFLAEDNCVLASNSTNSTTNSSVDLDHIRSSLAGHGAGLQPGASQYPLHTEGVVITKVSYAFWIMALINLPVPAAVLALLYHERLLPCSRTSPRLLDRDPASGSSPAADCGPGSHVSLFRCCNPEKLRGRPPSFFIIHALGGAILFITDGIIGSYAGFVYTYAVSPPLLMSHKSAGYLDSIFWASITAGRLAFIYLSYRYSAPRLLTVSLVGVIVVQCFLMIFYHSCVFLFIGTCVLGLCISSVFPSMLAFTEDILNYKGCATTVLVTSASTGEMILQLLVGSVIHSQGSYAFLLCCTIASFIGLCLFLLLLYVQYLHRKSTGKQISDLPDSSKSVDMKEGPK